MRRLRDQPPVTGAPWRAWYTSGLLSVLDGSAGGTWFDLTNVALPEVNFVEFSVTGAGQTMFVDAVVAIPEPASLGAVLLGAGALALRRRAGMR